MALNNAEISWWRTSFNNGEASSIISALANEHVSPGPIVQEFENKLAEYLGVPYVVATSNGSSAIIASLIAAGIGPGDEVIVPSRTWIATAHAPLLLGATVKVVDVDYDLPKISVQHIKNAITKKTKAIIPVHLCGRSVNMNEINEIAQQNQLYVIEDAAQALGSRNEQGYLGTQSDMGCFSLSVAKIISTGQGGFITTRSQEIYDKLILVRTHGVGDVINAKWEKPGFNFRFTDVLASIGLIQLTLLEERILKVKKIYEMYCDGLAGLERIKIIPVNTNAGEVPVYVEVLCDDREELIQFLKNRSIQCRPFYPSLHKASYFIADGSFLNSRKYDEMGIYLPAGPEQQLENIKIVINEINTFYKSNN